MPYILAFSQKLFIFAVSFSKPEAQRKDGQRGGRGDILKEKALF